MVPLPVQGVRLGYQFQATRAKIIGAFFVQFAEFRLQVREVGVPGHGVGDETKGRSLHGIPGMLLHCYMLHVQRVQSSCAAILEDTASPC